MTDDKPVVVPFFGLRPAPSASRPRVERPGIGGLTPDELAAWFVAHGQPAYRARQVLDAAWRGRQTSFMTELDGIHTIHLGEIGHQLTEEKLGDIGPVDIACVPVGGSLSATSAAALVAQLDPKIVVPMAVCEDEADCAEAMRQFLHEMGAQPTPQAKLSVTLSTLPTETTTVLLEARGKA